MKLRTTCNNNRRLIKEQMEKFEKVVSKLRYAKQRTKEDRCKFKTIADLMTHIESKNIVPLPPKEIFEVQKKRNLFIFAWNNFTSKNEPRFYQMGSAVIYFMIFLLTVCLDFAAYFGKTNIDITTPVVVGIISLAFSIGSLRNCIKNDSSDET